MSGDILSFIPGHNVADADLPQASEESESREDDGRKDRFEIVEYLEESFLL